MLAKGSSNVKTNFVLFVYLGDFSGIFKASILSFGIDNLGPTIRKASRSPSDQFLVSRLATISRSCREGIHVTNGIDAWRHTRYEMMRPTR